MNSYNVIFTHWMYVNMREESTLMDYNNKYKLFWISEFSFRLQ